MISVVTLATIGFNGHLLGRPISFVGQDAGFYHDNCVANWDTPTGRCPTAGDVVDLKSHEVVFKDWHQNDDIAFPGTKTSEDFGDAGNLVITGSQAHPGNLIIMEGNVRSVL